MSLYDEQLAVSHIKSTIDADPFKPAGLDSQELAERIAEQVAAASNTHRVTTAERDLLVAFMAWHDKNRPFGLRLGIGASTLDLGHRFGDKETNAVIDALAAVRAERGPTAAQAEDYFNACFEALQRVQEEAKAAE